MGSPISSTIAEIYLQHFEDIHIKVLIDTKNILMYTRYVDDIVIIYDTKRINPNISIHADTKLKTTYENNECISYLDLLIIRKPFRIETDTFRKPTTTN
jgi:hypothetical protein